MKPNYLTKGVTVATWIALGMIIGAVIMLVSHPLFVPCLVKKVIPTQINTTIEIHKNITIEKNLTILCPDVTCPSCICQCGNQLGEKSAYTIKGGWATNNSWWKNMTCSPGHNCTMV